MHYCNVVEIQTYNDILKYVFLLKIHNDVFKIPILISYNEKFIDTIPDLERIEYKQSLIDRIYFEDGVHIDIYDEVNETGEKYFDIAIGYD